MTAYMINVQNTEIWVKKSGKGRPILFLHGNPDTSDIWDDVVRNLPHGHICIRPNLPGFGRSQPNYDLDVSLKGMAEFVKELAFKLDLTDPFDLICHDIGGIYGMAFASEYPEQLRRLVISNAPFSENYRWHFWARVWRTPILGELGMLAVNSIIFSMTVKLGSKGLSDQFIKENYRQFSSATRKMVLKIYRALPEEDWKIWHPKLLEATKKIPTLVLWGEHDPFVPLKHAYEYGARKVKSFPTSGHWLPAEESFLFAEAVHAFLGADI